MNRWIALLTLVLAAACSASAGSTGQDGVPREPASIEGFITSRTDGGGGPTLQVERAPDVRTGEPVASVRLPRSVSIMASEGGRTRRAGAEDLAVGTRVRIWFTGPVAESYPVQAAAGTVLILR